MGALPADDEFAVNLIMMVAHFQRPVIGDAITQVVPEWRNHGRSALRRRDSGIKEIRPPGLAHRHIAVIADAKLVVGFTIKRYVKRQIAR